MTTVQAFLAGAYEQELAALRAALDAVPDSEFAVPRLGHSPAWHALHIAEWLRFFALQDLSPTYAHLGWEDSAWIGEFLGTPRLTETDHKDAILTELDQIGSVLIATIRGLRDDELNDPLRSPAAPTGTRERLAGLNLHLRHTAYHRGQLKQSLKVPV